MDILWSPAESYSCFCLCFRKLDRQDSHTGRQNSNKFVIKEIDLFHQILILLTLEAILSIIKINIYYSQDQENKFQMERSHLKRTFEKKVIYFVGSCKPLIQQRRPLRVHANFYKAMCSRLYFQVYFSQPVIKFCFFIFHVYEQLLQFDSYLC